MKINLHFLSILFVMLVWGTAYAVTKSAVTTITPVTFAFLRFLVASVMLCIVCMFKRQSIKPEQVPYTKLLPAALLGVPIYFCFLNYSLLYTSATNGAIIQGFLAPAIALASYMLLKEKIYSKQWGGIIFSLLGVLIIAVISKPDNSAPYPLAGNVLMIFAVVAWAVYTTTIRKLAAFNSLFVTTWITIAGTVFLLPLCIIELMYKGTPTITITSLWQIGYLGILSSGVCFLLYSNALKHYRASFVGVFLNLNPLIGALTALLFLQEKLYWFHVAGMVFILAGLWLCIKDENTRDTIAA